MNAMAFFHFICTFFTYFVVIFYIFPELTNHICEPKQWHRQFFSCFPCFCPTQRLTRFSEEKRGKNVSAVRSPCSCHWLVLKKVIKEVIKKYK